ncbi:anaerobic ribonucleoside-triphosphate reductase activating protein [Cryobacterium sp. TMT1-21]|uniref:Anaerobic ribonucleoside-triphosphate reductase-activating protein n=1 Tax=Cryobacterium shii TaxID=1259235 RepID=A0AAQ2HEU3_9MICO|nr:MULTISPECIES: anaerobic ribonucleoside-triphosphate reductase activating protein [Cryobacterium]TFC44371.1 anaerobic ribonucleoside-triphosphate reductase activating protein [Cryobacterium shii]TFC88441.1 anaerobic ribonucleoside-triphosphate reductase activating protein [Cryobacterium sp. TmT2-59]TFD17921.1 anaerobic ribonucleoside-triphosphate reductase activating protein [Cryobacterium sp. TMT1-21]TFD18916.1 anaerobic ribonucleoside-triphosphate reductase activating protein [Cryobacterium
MRNPQPGEWLSEKLSQQHVGDYKPFVFVDGEGVRCSLYLSGCLFACEGCFNEATWSFRYGQPYTGELEDQILADLGQEYVQGLTLLGGEPFLNTGVCLSLLDRVRRELGSSKDVWCWTGYTFEELLLESADKLALLGAIDVLVDGRFELGKRDPGLQFRGSSNQRIIDVKASLASGQVTLWGELKDATSSYEQIEKRNLI